MVDCIRNIFWQLSLFREKISTPFPIFSLYFDLFQLLIWVIWLYMNSSAWHLHCLRLLEYPMLWVAPLFFMYKATKYIVIHDQLDVMIMIDCVIFCSATLSESVVLETGHPHLKKANVRGLVCWTKINIIFNFIVFTFCSHQSVANSQSVCLNSWML